MKFVHRSKLFYKMEVRIQVYYELQVSIIDLFTKQNKRGSVPDLFFKFIIAQ